MRNSESTDGSNPSSSRSSPNAYFQEILSRTASAACRSVRFSAICITVTSANRPGDHPGRPRTPNAGANSASGNSSPSRSRTTTGNGGSRRRYAARTAAAISGAGSGHGIGCTDISRHLPTAGGQGGTDRRKIMEPEDGQHDHDTPDQPNYLASRVMNREDYDDGKERIVYGMGDEPWKVFINRPEKAGHYCFSPLGVLITAGARLMLALLERLVTDAGGSWAFCDTDSMCIIASPDGEPIQ